MNRRQRKAVRRMLEEGRDGFASGMSAKKYIAITKTSRATATRDLQDLTDMGVLVQTGAGRADRYHVNLS